MTQGEESAGLLAWLGLIGGYAWTVRSLARVRRRPAAGDVAAARGLRLIAAASPRAPQPPAARQPASGRVQMRITDLLTKELVLPALDARGSDEVIETLGMRVAAQHRDIERDRLVQALRERERQVTTALGDGVAIPHARLAGLERTVAAFARSRTGIQWESVDGKPTHLVFLLAGPADLPGAYLKVLAGVSRLLSDERCRARLMEAETETALLLVLREEEVRGRRGLRAA